MDRRKELKAQYKQMKPDMGVFVIRSKTSNLCYIDAVKDLKGMINRLNFQLGLGSFPDKELQKEWNALGKENFEFEVLEKLKYDKDESKTDYTEELELLQMIWEENLAARGIKLIKKTK